MKILLAIIIVYAVAQGAVVWAKNTGSALAAQHGTQTVIKG